MKFLTGLTLNLEKLPKYTAFSGEFILDIGAKNRIILENCSKTSNPVFKQEIKERIETILNHIYKNENKLIVKHHQKFNIGRFYPNESNSLITLSRHAKHTLFLYMNWIDIDMVKGHPTILYNLFKDIYEPIAFKKYIENPDEIFNKLLDFYAIDDTLNKDHIKQIFNIAIYGGSFNTWLKEIDEDNIEIKTDEMHPFIQEFINECKEISNIIFKNNTKLADKMRQYYKDEKDEWKIKNKVMSYFCQAIENEILHIAYKFLIKQNIITPRKNVELEYDGLCFKMPENKTINELENIIIELNDKILRETTLNVKFKIKPYDNRHIHSDIIEKTDIEINENINCFSNEEDDDDKTIPDIYTNKDNEIKFYRDIEDVLCSEEYYSDRAEFQKQFFKLEYPLLYGRLLEGELIPIFYKKNEMSELVGDFTPKYLIGTPKSSIQIPFYNIWRDDPEKRKYDKIVFEPNPALHNERHYNMFRGFKNDDPNVEPIKEEDSYYFKLLKHLFSPEPEFYNYFLALVSHIIQKPWIKTKVAVVLYTHAKGTGKDTIIQEGLQRIIGTEYFGKLNDIDDINAKFNLKLTNKLVVYGEEITANAKKVIDKLKEVITRSTCNLEKKGVDAVMVNDFCNLFFTTNIKNSFKVEQGCRRLGIMECNETKLPTDFFVKLYDEINDPIKIKQIFRFFKLYKQDKYNIGTEAVYNTNCKKELEQESKQGYIQFLYKSVNAYANMSGISSTKLYEMSKEFCNKNFISSNYTITEFGTATNKILLKFRVRKSTGYTFNFTNSLDILQTLYEYDANYYRYVNNLDADFIPSFKHEPQGTNPENTEIEELHF